ncbi:hypothetical protein HDU85_003961 [Gaertneriomyces sp. JEL0708]|nr:hypothetical protein HDU85_003961 [Gaertneriomyces sp. JEL0708]
MNSTSGVNPSDQSGSGTITPSPYTILQRRCDTWSALVKILIRDFAAQAAFEKKIANQERKASKQFDKTHVGDRFADSNGVTAIITATKENAVNLASHHAALRQHLQTQLVPSLKAIQKKLRDQSSHLSSTYKRRHSEKEADERKLQRLITKLDHAIAAAGGRSEEANYKAGDPWLANEALKQHLKLARRRYLHPSPKDIIHEYATFEKNILDNLKATLSAYTSLDAVQSPSNRTLHEAVTNLNAEQEWNGFMNVHFPNLTVPDAFTENYPNAGHDLTKIAVEAPVLRPAMFNKWKQEHLVLTSAGWLHWYKSKPDLDSKGIFRPKRSYWLGNCDLLECGKFENAMEFHIKETKARPGLFHKRIHEHRFATDSTVTAQGWSETLKQHIAGMRPVSRAPSLIRDQASVTEKAVPEAVVSGTFDNTVYPEERHRTSGESVPSTSPADVARRHSLDTAVLPSLDAAAPTAKPRRSSDLPANQSGTQKLGTNNMNVSRGEVQTIDPELTAPAAEDVHRSPIAA